jgi:cell division transport system permease protein
MKRSINRIFKAGWLNFKRNSYLSFGTTGIMVLVLLLFSGLMALNFTSSRIISMLQEKVDVSIYFKTEALEEEIMKVKSDLEKQAEVKTVEYISKDRALEEFKARHAGDALIQDSLAELDINPLQASLNVKAKESSQYATIVNFVEANKFRVVVDKINYYENEAVISRVEGLYKGLQNWGFIMTMVLAVVAVLVTFNTIRLTIYNQRQEIEIMRLVGGSNWHIKAPFMVEGGLYGVLAGLICIFLFYPILYLVSPKMDVLMPGLGLMSYFAANAVQYFLLITLSGIALGVISSTIAIRRFLKI